MNKLRITQNKTGAFTLVELIVVIVILAILATIAFLSFSSQSSSVRDSTRLSDMSNISK
jgi:prepilin-type N-terminal cleavage/methylation domain-containing protein